LIAVTMPLMYVFKKKKGSNSGISLISALVWFAERNTVNLKSRRLTGHWHFSRHWSLRVTILKTWQDFLHIHCLTLILRATAMVAGKLSLQFKYLNYSLSFLNDTNSKTQMFIFSTLIEGSVLNSNTIKFKLSARGYNFVDPDEMCHQHVVCKLYWCKVSTSTSIASKIDVNRCTSSSF
jgi:hypothetical protein